MEEQELNSQDNIKEEGTALKLDTTVPDELEKAVSCIISDVRISFQRST